MNKIIESNLLQQSDGGVYLVIADDSHEFDAALEKAMRMACRSNRHIAILYTMQDQAFLHWGIVEKRIQKDLRAEAEKRIWEVISRVYQDSGLRSVIYIKEGKKRQAILDVLNDDPNIKMLVLGAGTASSNPLVSYFTGKGLSGLKVPLLVVPDNI